MPQKSTERAQTVFCVIGRVGLFRACVRAGPFSPSDGNAECRKFEFLIRKSLGNDSAAVI
jgi:hypothetical protein